MTEVNGSTATWTPSLDVETNVITAMERRKAYLREQIKAEQARHESAIKGLRDEFALAEVRIQTVAAGIDEEKLLLAEHVLFVYGTYVNGGEDRHSVVADAKADVLAGGPKLRSEFFGTKSYDRWHGQRSDHGYGYGPGHGSIIFEIGMSRPLRESGRELTADEIEAALYFLTNLEAIQAAQAKAKAASA